MYVCNSSKTDPFAAPKGHENLSILVPIAPGLSYTEETLETYANHILRILEETLHLDGLRSRIVCKRLFCIKDFEQRYRAPQGTALGLAHTLRQSAAGRPSNVHKKVAGPVLCRRGHRPGYRHTDVPDQRRISLQTPD